MPSESSSYSSLADRDTFPTRSEKPAHARALSAPRPAHIPEEPLVAWVGETQNGDKRGFGSKSFAAAAGADGGRRDGRQRPSFVEPSGPPCLGEVERAFVCP